MKNKSILIVILLVLIGMGIYFAYFYQKPKAKLKQKPEIPLQVRTVDFASLPGWHNGSFKTSLNTFLVSCNTFLRQNPEKSVGSEFFDLKAKDWHAVCKAAKQLDINSNVAIKNFFQQWFVPVEFYQAKISMPTNCADKEAKACISKTKSLKGLFTGYYMPLLKGSIAKTEKYNVPLYTVPNNLITLNLKEFADNLPNRTIVGRVNGRKLIPYYTRAEINQGALKNEAAVIAWLENPVDRIFLEIQGSGIIQFDNKSQITINYAAQNGAPYTSIAKVLINKGVMNKDNASMQRIKDYLNAHKDQVDAVLNQNKSFVFFEKLKKPMALGSQGVSLTPGYSLAIDTKWVPIGTPIWLNTTRPDENSTQNKQFQRLMIAQDTGGAIKGPVRGDVYWGAGEKATTIAGRMKNHGSYWLLLPRQVYLKYQKILAINSKQIINSNRNTN